MEPEPAVNVPEIDVVCPIHTELGVADALAVGLAFTVTVVVVVPVHPKLSVTVTVYVPLIATVAFVLLGF